MSKSYLYKFKAIAVIDNKKQKLRSIIRLTKSYLLNTDKRIKLYICDWASIKSSQIISLKFKKIK